MEKTNDKSKDIVQFFMLGTPNHGSVQSYFTGESGMVQPYFEWYLVPFVQNVIDGLAYSELEGKYPIDTIYNMGDNEHADAMREMRINAVEKYIPTAKELLPTKESFSGSFNYLRDTNRNPISAPDNNFLDNLNSDVSALSAIPRGSFFIRGDGGMNRTDNSTRQEIDVQPYTGQIPNAFPDGQPIEWRNYGSYIPWYQPVLSDNVSYMLSHDRDTTQNEKDEWLGEGDSTVQKDSVPLPGVTDLGTVHASHAGIPNNYDAKYKILYAMRNIQNPIISTDANSQIPSSMATFAGMSPFDVLVTDPDGRRAGMINGQKINEIPGAIVFGLPGKGQSVYILDPLQGQYKVSTLGASSGWGVLRVASLTEENSQSSDLVVPTDQASLTNFQVVINTPQAGVPIQVQQNLSVKIVNGTKGNENWFASPVTVEATLLDGSDQSIQYSINDGPWQTYLDRISITDDGNYTLKFKTSVTNEEAVLNFKKDATPPAINVNDGNIVFTRIDQVSVSVTDPLSGLQSSAVSFDGQPIKDPSSIPLWTFMDGVHTTEVVATDRAGNTETKDISITIKATTQSLITTINRLQQSGDIDNVGIANSLLVKVKKDQKESVNDLNAFQNELDAQKGKHVSAIAYQLLSSDIQSLISQQVVKK